MSEYDDATYGDRIAEVYDEFYPELDHRVVPLLAELAGKGRALELGIGTGRVGLPLQAAGVNVEGIDASAAMVARLRAKPGGERIPVAIGSFVDVNVEGEFSLVFVVFNTFFGLGSQDEQVRCFQGVAQRLAPGGAFLVEAFVPDMARFVRGQNLSIGQMGPGHVMLDAARLDRLNQRVVTQHVVLSEAGVRTYPVQLRFAWPAELDLMARIAGLRLRDRWGGWGKEPFAVDSGGHISVYVRQ